MKWCMVFYQADGSVCTCMSVRAHMCVLNEEAGSTICPTAATQDDEIVSERKSTCVCPAWPPAPPLTPVHTHMEPHTVTLPLSPFSLSDWGATQRGNTGESNLLGVEGVLLLSSFLFFRQPLLANGGWKRGKGCRYSEIQRERETESTCKQYHRREGMGAWVQLRGRTALQLVLQFLDRATLCLTPRLKAELRQARPPLADKQRILSPPAHLSRSAASVEGED